MRNKESPSPTGRHLRKRIKGGAPIYSQASPASLASLASPASPASPASSGDLIGPHAVGGAWALSISFEFLMFLSARFHFHAPTTPDDAMSSSEEANGSELPPGVNRWRWQQRPLQLSYRRPDWGGGGRDSSLFYPLEGIDAVRLNQGRMAGGGREGGKRFLARFQGTAPFE